MNESAGTVLVVDVDRRYVGRARKALAAAGLEVESATAAADAALAIERGADVVVLVDGLEGAGDVSRAAAERGVPLLLVRAKGANGKVAIEAAAVLARPLGHGSLAAVVAAHARARRLAVRLETLERHADPIDHHTGLYRFERVKPLLAAEVKRARRYRYPFSLLIVAFDGIDRVREQHGEETAATLSGGLARAVAEAVRELDLPIAFGDGKILVLMPHTPRRGGRVVGERIRTRLKRTRLADGEDKVWSTACIGLAAYDGEGVVSFSRLAREAGEALKIAKAAGGDRVAEVPATRRERATAAKAAPRRGRRGS